MKVNEIYPPRDPGDSLIFANVLTVSYSVFRSSLQRDGLTGDAVFALHDEIEKKAPDADSIHRLPFFTFSCNPAPKNEIREKRKRGQEHVFIAPSPNIRHGEMEISLIVCARDFGIHAHALSPRRISVRSVLRFAEGSN